MEKNLLQSLISSKINIIAKPVTASTNTDAEEYIKQGTPHVPTLIFANEQTAGRGRSGKSFLSPKGGIYMSLVAKAPGAEWLSLVTPAAAVAVKEGIKKICHINCGIKWVNDIFFKEKKVCGILTSLVNGHIIVGIGINWSFGGAIPKGIEDIAAALYSGDPPQNITPEALAAEIIENLLFYLQKIENRLFLTAYKNDNIVLGKEIIFSAPGGQITARAVDINPSGHLVLQLKSGETRAFSSGSVVTIL